MKVGQLYCWLKDYMHWPEDKKCCVNIEYVSGLLFFY